MTQHAPTTPSWGCVPVLGTGAVHAPSLRAWWQRTFQLMPAPSMHCSRRVSRGARCRWVNLTPDKDRVDS
eukprot:801448-Pelagomonas_calceolata.AAC.7